MAFPSRAHPAPLHTPTVRVKLSPKGQGQLLPGARTTQWGWDPLVRPQILFAFSVT